MDAWKIILLILVVALCGDHIATGGKATENMMLTIERFL